MKKTNSLIITGILATVFATAPIVYANPIDNTAPKNKSYHCLHKHCPKSLGKEECGKFMQIVKAKHTQLKPIIKEQRALRAQLKGKIATPGTKWNDLAPMVSKINKNREAMTIIKVNTQLQLFQELGLLKPNAMGTNHFHAHKHIS